MAFVFGKNEFSQALRINVGQPAIDPTVFFLLRTFPNK